MKIFEMENVKDLQPLPWFKTKENLQLSAEFTMLVS